MKVLAYIELSDGHIKKTSLEAIVYAASVSPDVEGIVIGHADKSVLEKAGAYGAKKVWHANSNEDDTLLSSKILEKMVKDTGAELVVSSKSAFSDEVLARVAGALGAGLVANVVALPDMTSGFKVKRSIFTGKAFAFTEIKSALKVIQIKKNVVELIETANTAVVESVSIDGISGSDAKVIENLKASGSVSLPEADLVVSGGRGMKGPEHWQPLLDLAEALGAATACSKPVSDLDWRPHHEHVGQTGVKVSPNLYIACGISGAIQHLAGVNSSKVIVVINKDPEAPFFKAADYGIVGDVFDVLPKLTEAVKAM